jgi:alpha-beta hydrolase superfamily lysophospholipase
VYKFKKMILIYFICYGGIYSQNYDSLRTHLPTLHSAIKQNGVIIPIYHHKYGLDTLGVVPVIGTFESDSFTCVGQIFRPEKPVGTVFFLHGYFDHTGTQVNGIRACLQEHFTVAAMDLPGHGLSSGVRGAIDEFSEYVHALEQFVISCENVVDTPYIFIGHSTGCAVGYEYTATVNDTLFSKMLFLAPLVRSSLFHLSKVGNVLLSPFLKTTPRWFRKSSHDKQFLKRFRQDPLEPDIFPLRWAIAYYRWFDRIAAYPVCHLSLFVIQGSGDKVVDWRFNLPWLENKVKGVTIVTIPKARHHLLNESMEYRTACLDTLRYFLRKPLRQ